MNSDELYIKLIKESEKPKSNNKLESYSTSQLKAELKRRKDLK